MAAVTKMTEESSSSSKNKNRTAVFRLLLLTIVLLLSITQLLLLQKASRLGLYINYILSPTASSSSSIAVSEIADTEVPEPEADSQVDIVGPAPINASGIWIVARWDPEGFASWRLALADIILLARDLNATFVEVSTLLYM
jgi:hypothetical protein